MAVKKLCPLTIITHTAELVAPFHHTASEAQPQPQRLSLSLKLLIHILRGSVTASSCSVTASEAQSKPQAAHSHPQRLSHGLKLLFS